MDTEHDPQQVDDRDAARDYEPPRIERLGTLAELTRGSGGAYMDMGGGYHDAGGSGSLSP
jgi:hypothetical protein